MKFSESKLLVLLASIILGFLLASQISLGKFKPSEVLTLQSYQRTYSELRKLIDENSMLSEKNETLSLELFQKQSDQSFSKVINNLTEELNKYDFYAGLTDVYGPGVIVSLSDNPAYDKVIDSRDIDEYGLVHDYDILHVLWDLKNAGAEAISINDQRIISNSDIYCGGPIIYVNGVKLVPPYIIKAIGESESLSYALKQNTSYFKWLEDRGLFTNLKKENTINILKYDRIPGYIYVKPVKE